MAQFIRISQHEGEGIGAFVGCDEFLVSILNPLPRLCPEQTTSMQKHNETEECFILLSGRAMLYLADGDAAPGELRACLLELGKIYTVPRGIWHSPVMSSDAKILLVEKNGTTDDNSPRVPLTEDQRHAVLNLGKELWT